MVITAIEPQQKNKDRVSIFFDGQFGMGLHIEVLADQHLKIGQQLSDNDIQQLRLADAYRTSYDRAVNYLSVRPRSEREVQQYLTDRLIYKHSDYSKLDSHQRQEFKQQQEQIIVQIIDRLKDKKYLDDAAFAKWWIDNRRQFRPRGQRLLLVELQSKGISATDIKAALETPDESGQFLSEVEAEVSKPSEKDLAMSLARKQQKKYVGLETIQYKQKMSRYLASKGFDWDTIDAVIKELLDNS